MDLPCWKLGADIICRAHKSRLGQRAAKDHELAQANRTRLFSSPPAEDTVRMFNSESVQPDLLTHRGR